MFFQRVPWALLSLINIGFTAEASTTRGQQNVRRQTGPVAPDTVKNCTYFVDAQAQDICLPITNGWGISTQQFLAYNPSIKSDFSGLTVGNSYCIEENFGNGPVSTSTILTSTSRPLTNTTTLPASAGPSPTQTGITTQCMELPEFDNKAYH